MEMERETNQLEAGPILCRTGCGFFGSSNTDGLCSKCYKDLLKKKQQPPITSSTITSPAASTPPPPPSLVVNSTSTIATSTAQPTVPALSQNLNSSVIETKDSSTSTSDAAISLPEEEEASSPESEGAKKKKNKCLTCKKKVGLTGFTCRCGGLYCSVHRYSNEHRCTFDYRELGAEEIRRNNPVVKGEKIQKI